MLIDRNQVLLICNEYTAGRQWTGDPAEVYATAKDVALANLDDSIVGFAVMTPDEGTVIDITEDVAKAYLDAHPDTHPYDEHVQIPYIQGSRAWRIHCADYDHSRPVNQPRVYGTLRAVAGGVA